MRSKRRMSSKSRMSKMRIMSYKSRRSRRSIEREGSVVRVE